MAALMRDVAAFHAAHGSADPTNLIEKPCVEVVRLRAKLITEEYCETIVAMFAGNTPEVKALLKEMLQPILDVIDQCPADHFDLEATADGLADLIYVSVGTALALGMTRFPSVWSEVQRSNMDKLGGGRREDGKILKPEGWKPPHIHHALYDVAV